MGLLVIIGSIVDVIGGGGVIRLFNKHHNLHFDNMQGIHMSFGHSQGRGYDLDGLD